MKFYIDLASRRFIKAPNSPVPLQRVFFKRRDIIDVEVIFVDRSAVVPTPVGTTLQTALKRSFSDPQFLAAAANDGTLNLYTVPVEELFPGNTASASALLEVKYTRPGEETRTATLAVELQNSVILGTEGTPAAMPDLKATLADAEAGTDNTRWMTPLRVWDAIRKAATAAVTWANLPGKPSTFPPEAHTHQIAQIDNLTESLAAKQPIGNYASAIHTHDASELTSGQIDIDRLPVLPSQVPVVVEGTISEVLPSQESQILAGTVVTTTDGERYVYKGVGDKNSPASYIVLADITPVWASITGKPSAFPPSTHTHTVADVTGLQASLDAKQPAGSYATAAQGAKADSALQPSALTPYRTATAQDAIDAGKASTTHTHTAAQISDFAAAVAAVAPPATPVSVAANSGITSTANTLATAYNTTIADSVVSVSVGGAPAAPASAWKAKNLVQVLDDILFPTILASVGSAKSTSLTVSGASGILEIGTSVARTLTATFSRGTILNGTGATNANPLVGAATGFTFTGTGISSTAQAGNTLAFTTAVVSGANAWSVTVAHSAGTGTYTDNKGAPGTNLASARAAGTSSDSTPTITGVHPYYYLKSASPISAAAMVTAIQSGTATKVVASSTGTLSIPYAPSAEYLAVAYPSTSTTKTRYHVTALDNGAITVVFSPVATQTVTTAIWSQSYKIHVSASALTNSNSTIELRNS